MEKVLKRKDDKLYVKWKGINKRFNSWIDKKDLEWKFTNESFKCKLLNEILKFYKWNFLNCLNCLN